MLSMKDLHYERRGDDILASKNCCIEPTSPS